MLLALLVVAAMASVVTSEPPAAPLSVAHADPVDIDPDILCGINGIAYKWSLRALPERAPLVSSFDALRLAAQCNQSRPSTAGAPGLSWRRPVHGSDYVFEAARQGTVSRRPRAVPAFYVDYETGSDSGPGSEAQPFKTVYRAIGAARAAKAVESDPAAPAQVVLRGGTHPLTRRLDLTSADSGVTISNFPGEEPVLSLGVELTGLSWSRVSSDFSDPVAGLNGVSDLAASGPGGNITTLVPGVRVLGTASNATGCQDLCAAERQCTSWTWHDASQGAFALQCLAHTDGVWQPTKQAGHTSGQRLNVWRADVSHLGLEPFSQLWQGESGAFRRLTRARFPSANPEIFGLWTAPETGWVPSAKSWAPPVSRPAAVEIDVSKPLNNGTDFPGFPIGIGGPGVGFFHPPRSYWTTASPTGGGGATYHVPGGFTWDETTWTDKTWKHSTKGAVAGAYQGGHWGSWVFEVDSVDTSSNSVTFGRGGFQEARGSRNGGELYVENILEELDSPGEWYFDVDAQQLYLYPNSTDSAPADAGLVAAQGKYAIRVSGSQAAPAVNITLSGITFAHADATYLDDFEVPSSGDFAVHRGGVVTASGVEGLAVENCLFRSPGGNGIVVAGYARNVSLSGNEIVWAGESGVLILGDCYLLDCTNGDQPHNILVEKNLVHEYGIYNQQSAAVFVAKSANVTIDRLVAFNGPRQGTVWNDGAFGGHEIRDSAIYMTVRSTGDCGPVYAWMRTTYLHNGPDGTPTLKQAESTVHNSVLLTNWHGVWPVDLDDGSAYVTAQGNLMAWGGFKNYLGHSKRATGNVYVYPDAQRAPPPPEGDTAEVGGFFTKPFCANSDGQQLGRTGWGESWTNNTCFLHSSNVYEFGSCNTNSWQELVPLTADNRFFTDSGTAEFNCGSDKGMTLAAWQKLGEDLGSSVAVAPATADIVKVAHDVLQW